MPRTVLFVAYHFPPSGGPAVQRSAKFVKYLPEFGYRPLVLTAADEDIEYLSRDETLLDEVRDAQVTRCAGYARYVIRWPRRLRLNAVTSFFLRPDKNILAWVPPAARAAVRLAAREPVDAIYTSIGPASSVLLGARLKRRLGVPWIVDYRDPWTDDGMGMWPSRWHYRWECRQERRALETADAIVVVTPGMQAMMAARYPTLAHRIHLIPNGFDRADFPACAPRPPDNLLRISYTGASIDYDFRPEVVRVGALVALWVARFGFRTEHYDLSTYSPLYLFRAVRDLLAREPQRAGRLELCFAGHFGPRNRALVQELGLQGIVRELGYVPHRDSVRVLMESDLLFISLPTPETGRRSYHYSGKLFEYLAAGRPILGAIPPGDARDLIERARAGWCVDPRDTGRLSCLIGELMDRKVAGTLRIDPDRQLIEEYDRRRLTGRLAAVLDAIVD
jgi:glycosyltransferase involved in cell wall biosynthesis